MTRCVPLLAFIAVLAQPIAAGPAAAQIVIVPFGSCDWKYYIGATGSTAAVSSRTLDDSDWPVGCCPFVPPWGCLTPGTTVAPNQRVVFRRHIFNHGPANSVLRYRVRARGPVETAWNGHSGNGHGFVNECEVTPQTGAYPLDPGDNVILFDFYPGDDPVHELQLGGDVEVELSVDDVTAVTPRTWGSVKAIYR